MGMEDERDRLSQARLLAWLNRDIPLTEMATVYLSDDSDSHSRGIYCALIPAEQVDESLGYPTWDLGHGEGLPGTLQYREEDETVAEYLRFGTDSGIEPLVINRDFAGIRPDYEELSEEFRFFHNLCYDPKGNQYIKIDRSGNEHVAAIVEPNRIQIRMLEIRQFLAVKEMHLSIQFDCLEYSCSTLEELGLNEGASDSRDGLLSWRLIYSNSHGTGDRRSVSCLIGKRLISPLPKEKSGFWGFAPKEKKKYVDFIIGVDEGGGEITHTSNPNSLGAGADSAHYLTPVHFRKQVLDRYYQQPSKYSVGDGILRCARLWSMFIDNDRDDKVCAWLGDLGEHLPYEEQLHWRSHNIAPTGGMSKVFVGRQLSCQFMDSERPEHEFERAYDRLRVTCDEMLGWRLLLLLAQDDIHCLQAIRIPASNEQKEFDDLVLALTKVLVDSLNVKELTSLLAVGETEKREGSIARLEAVLAARGVTGYEGHIGFLRKLQGLRSSGAAHRKRGNYRKVANKFGVDSQSLQTVFREILKQASEVLDYLTSVVRSGSLLSPVDKSDPLRRSQGGDQSQVSF